MKLKLSSIVISIIIGFISGYSYHLIKSKEVISTKIAYKTRTVTITVYLDKFKIIGTVLPEDTMYLPTDTAELIARYKKLWMNFYSKNKYKDTLQFDTLGYAVLNEQIFMNKRDSLNYTYKINTYEKMATTVVHLKNQLFVGGMVGRDNISPMIMLNRNDKYAFFVNYNLQRGSVSCGAMVRIGR